MRGWALSSNTLRANRHWQSSGGNNCIDIFTDALFPQNIASTRATMFSLDRLFSPGDKTSYGEYVRGGAPGFSIITMSYGVKEFKHLTNDMYFSRLWYKDIGKVHIQADQNIAVDGLKIYLTGLVFDLLHQPEGGYYTWVKPDSTQKADDLVWGSMYAYGVSSGIFFSGNTYINDFVNITITPKTTETFLMPTWGLSGPNNQSEMDQKKTIERSGVLLTDGLDLTVEFKDPSKCNALLLTEMGFCTNSYELKSWQWAHNSSNQSIYAWDSNISRSYKLKAEVIK